MKRKELYEYIREEIINELSLAESNTDSILYGKDSNSKTQAIKRLKTTKTYRDLKPQERIETEDNIKKDTDGGVLTVQTESELEEMSRPASLLKIQDPAKLVLAKEIYTAGRINALLTALEAAGEGGMTQDQLGTALGLKSSSVLNSVINNLRTAGVLTPPTPKKEKIAKVEPEISPEIDTEVEDEIDDDEFYKDDEETTPEEKPEVASDKETKQVTGNIDTSKAEEINQLIIKIKEISKKILAMKKGLDRDVKIKALTQMINKNKKLLRGQDISALTNKLIG